MFGSARRKATAFAIEATSPIIKTLEIRGPVPAEFWADPYYLGYLTWTIVTFAKASNEGLKGKDLGICLFDTLSAISGRNGTEIGTLATNFAESRNENFIQGQINAEKLLAVTYGSRDFDDDPDVIAATKKADTIGTSLDLGKPLDRGARIASCLGIIVFYDRVKRQFNR